MFTGIITAIGHISAVKALGDTQSHGKRLTVSCPAGYLDDVDLGDSIALNGACMTVTAADRQNDQFTIDISAESLARTAGLDATGAINLEKALRANDRLGGHLVSGHVDGIGSVTHFARRSARVGSCGYWRRLSSPNTWPTKAPSPSMASA
jgi:riboflavin synthase